MDYVELYYSDIVGCYPFNTDEERIKTQKIIDYLIDAGIPEQEIIRFIQEAPAVGVLTPDDLPEWLWEGSLLRKNAFYYHGLLHVKSNAPVFNPMTRKESFSRFYLEMKIMFSMDELIEYFYKKMDINTILMDRNKDSGAFRYLLDKYGRFAKFVEPIDFVLAEIDYAANANTEADNVIKINNVLGIDAYISEVYDMLQKKVAEATLAKANKIVWR